MAAAASLCRNFLTCRALSRCSASPTGAVCVSICLETQSLRSVTGKKATQLVDWGHGNFGAEAASQAYFHKSASQLTRAEAARLAAVLPDPEKWHADRPGPYVAGRTGTIVSRAGEVTRDDLDACVR